MQLSLMLGNLRQPFEQSLDTVQQLELPAIHLSATGEWDPNTCDTQKRRDLLANLHRRGLVISALSRWGGNVDLGDAATAEASVADAKLSLEMAADLMSEDLGFGIWQAHIGVMPRSMSGPRWESFLKTADEIARHGEKVGACLAIETGPEPPAVVEKLITTIDSPGLRVNYDPANLILWPNLFHTYEPIKQKYGEPAEPYNKETALRDYEPVEGVKRLGKFTVHTHAKDALVEDGMRREVPLGEGWVDWPRYLQLLKDSGYDGYLAIEREAGADPVADMTRAAEFLRGQLRDLENAS